MVFAVATSLAPAQEMSRVRVEDATIATSDRLREDV
jgi:hypothetical protein